MIRTRALFVFGFILSVWPLAAAHNGQSPTQVPSRPGAPQGANAPPPKSTAIVLGQVIDGSTGQPIAEAIVTLRPIAPGARGRGMPDAAALGALMGDSSGNAAMAEVMSAAMARMLGPGQNREQKVLTGGDGRFVFHSLAPGQYQLAAALSGYAATLAGSSGRGMAALFSIASAGGTPDTPSIYALREGEHVADIKLRLWKYASVSGTVIDDGGEPAIGLMVQVLRRIMVGGRARYLPAGNAKTDDRGLYRIATLLPGEYIVAMPQTQVALPAAAVEGLMKMGLASASGGQVDQAAAEVMAEVILGSGGAGGMSAMSNGVRLGGYMVASTAGAVPLLGPDGRLSAYQTAFYAGAATPVQATVITLKSGEERTGADLQLRLTPTVRVSGVATGPTGPMANLGVKLVVPGDSVVSETEFEVATSVTAADGSFSFFGVPPGQFLLRAQRDPRPTAAAAGIGMAVAGAAGLPQAAPGAPQKTLFAAVNIAVGTSDLDGVAVTLSEGFTVSGRFETDSQASKPFPGPLQNLAVTLMPADGRAVNIMSMASIARPARVAEDGTFQTQALVPGRYFLTAGSLMPGWQVKGAMLAGRDVYDAPLEVRSGDLSGLIVTLTDRVGQLTGTVTATGAQKATESMIVVLPADYRGWIESGMNPRRARTARPAANAGYTIANLPPGEYLAIAVDRSDEGDLQDPAFVEALARAATRVTIGAEVRKQDLAIARVRR